jgi:hypothetical protein
MAVLSYSSGIMVRSEFMALNHFLPVTVAERSRACTVFAHLEAGTVVLNPTKGMDV